MDDDDKKKSSFDDFPFEIFNLLKDQGKGKSFVRYQTEEKEKDTGAKQIKEEEDSLAKINFDLKPKEVKAYLDRYVIKQDEAKKVLSIAICDHYNHIKRCQKNCKHYTKQNVLIMGPTGVGKTYLVKCIANLIGVPFIKSDATKFTETGYIGGDVEDLIRQLVSVSKNDVKLAEYGIVFLDEIDKIAASSDKYGKDVSGRGVQSNLLKILEDTDVPIKSPWDIQAQIKGMMQGKKQQKETINTKHILFIVSGAFVGLDDIVKNRTQGTKFGFENGKNQIMNNEENILNHMQTKDFIKYGLEPEFIGRLPVRVFCEELLAKDLLNILKYSEDSLIFQLKESFRNYGIEIEFSEEALINISKLAYEEGTGARGLSTVLEKVLREYKFELPSHKIKHLLITSKIILEPVKYLNKIIEKPDQFEKEYTHYKIDQFEKKYALKHGLKIIFNKEIRNQIYKMNKNSTKNIEGTLNDMLQPLQNGFRLLKNKSKEALIISKNVMAHPETHLENWIKESFTH
jgi:endopeptidase Clp ATP-binding regulatory subunit ClpX